MYDFRSSAQSTSLIQNYRPSLVVVKSYLFAKPHTAHYTDSRMCNAQMLKCAQLVRQERYVLNTSMHAGSNDIRMPAYANANVDLSAGVTGMHGAYDNLPSTKLSTQSIWWRYFCEGDGIFHRVYEGCNIDYILIYILRKRVIFNWCRCGTLQRYISCHNHDHSPWFNIFIGSRHTMHNPIHTMYCNKHI